MSEILREIEEDLRRERLLQVWRRYSVVIIAGAVAIVLSAAGMVGWRAWSEHKNQRATGAFFAVLESQPRADAFADYAAQAPGNLSALAQFYEAGKWLESNRRDVAVKVYQGIAKDHRVTKDMRDLATLLAAWNQMDARAPEMRETLIQQLEPLTPADNPWHFSAREITGYLQVTTGMKDKGLETLRSLAADTMAPEGVRRRAQDMLTVYGG